jgi:hypothetical protein
MRCATVSAPFVSATASSRASRCAEPSRIGLGERASASNSKRTAGVGQHADGPGCSRQADRTHVNQGYWLAAPSFCHEAISTNQECSMADPQEFSELVSVLTNALQAALMLAARLEPDTRQTAQDAGELRAAVEKAAVAAQRLRPGAGRTEP